MVGDFGIADGEGDEAGHEEDGGDVLREAAAAVEADLLDDNDRKELAALEHHLRWDVEVLQAHVGKCKCSHLQERKKSQQRAIKRRGDSLFSFGGARSLPT